MKIARKLAVGMLLLLSVGAAAWLVLRSEPLHLPADAPTQSAKERPRVAAERVPAVRIGDVAPNFTLQTLHAGAFELSDHRGGVVLLNFWATWCAPCRDEMPDLVMLQDSLDDQGLVVVGVSLDEEGRDVVADFYQTFPVDYPLLIDGLSVAREYGAHHVVPTTYVVDREGHVADRFEGAMTIEELLPRMRRHVQQVE
ncbi:MAG: redoxin domain-containing protein [Rhodothermales bacterium]